MNIATSLNRKYVRYAGVMLYSFAANNPVPADVWILHNELTENDLSYLASCVSSFAVTIHSLHIDDALFPESLPVSDSWSKEAYFRLLLPDLLPADTERVLYLDVDIIVNRNISAFYLMPFEDRDLIATEDACGSNVPADYGEMNQKMLGPMYEKGHCYFCSGVVLFNIAGIRKKYSFKTYLDAFEAWNYQMDAPDQDILNWVHWQHVGYVDPLQYNLFARIAHNRGMSYEDVRSSCSIIHFAGDKPWHSRNVHFDIERLWWDYALKTPDRVQLLEAFLESSLRDYPRVENYILQLEKQNAELKSSLQQAMNLLRKISSQ